MLSAYFRQEKVWNTLPLPVRGRGTCSVPSLWRSPRYIQISWTQFNSIDTVFEESIGVWGRYTHKNIHANTHARNTHTHTHTQSRSDFPRCLSKGNWVFKGLHQTPINQMPPSSWAHSAPHNPCQRGPVSRGSPAECRPEREPRREASVMPPAASPERPRHRVRLQLQGPGSRGEGEVGEKSGGL